MEADNQNQQEQGGAGWGGGDVEVYSTVRNKKQSSDAPLKVNNAMSTIAG